jgi:hypothetical protein
MDLHSAAEVKKWVLLDPISAKCQCNVVIRDKVFAKETCDWLHNTAPGGFIEKIHPSWNPSQLCNQLLFIHLLYMLHNFCIFVFYGCYCKCWNEWRLKINVQLNQIGICHSCFLGPLQFLIFEDCFKKLNDFVRLIFLLWNLEQSSIIMRAPFF